ncbi:tripartite tricarboxylate transporter TctB family protein [Ralstonia solanacearum]|uniref:tripartite tricarboxylate transporter TctB family protein n=1 Tax=Ralstonia solanacearum TaxID=305 RepID=UPI000F61CE2A|nr:tripartite tricarboxylate transporter TctB family protein [Ralstonia solanacearum]
MPTDPPHPPVIRSHQDFASGILFIITGATFAILARGYRMGTASNMGPGYFPFWLGVVLVLLEGVADRIPRWDIKTLLWILGSVVLFGLLLQPLGLVLSLVVLVLVSSMASHAFTWKGAIGTAIVMVLLSLAAFVYGLKLQFPVWPAFIGS